MSEKRSRYIDAGSPTCCLSSSCGAAFTSKCFRGSDGKYFCSKECASGYGLASEHTGLSKRAAQLATVCECINQCFAFDMWCYDFARHVDEQDMVMGLHVAFDLMTASTRLFSFLALRKLDEFLRSSKSRADDLIASDLDIDKDVVLGGLGQQFLSMKDRVSINKRAAHLTEWLTLEDETEIDLRKAIDRSRPIFGRLLAEIRKADAQGEITQWVDKTDSLINYAEEQTARVESEHRT